MLSDTNSCNDGEETTSLRLTPFQNHAL